MLTRIRESAAQTLLPLGVLFDEGHFRSLAEAIPCAIFISQCKRLSYVNHAAERRGCLSEGGETIEALLRTADREVVQDKEPGGGRSQPPSL